MSGARFSRLVICVMRERETRPTWANAASKFAQHLADLKLAPPHAGILRIIGSTPALTQQAPRNGSEPAGGAGGRTGVASTYRATRESRGSSQLCAAPH